MDTISKAKNPDRPIRVVGWEEFDRLIDRLEFKINESDKKFEGIYGIPRGGLMVAVCLSHRLNIPLLTKKSLITTKILIVDDIVDSSITLQKYINISKKIVTASLFFRKIRAEQEPDFWVVDARFDWIRFPWEDE